MQSAERNKTWMVVGSIVFAAAGGLSLLLTDLILVPASPGAERNPTDYFWFSKSPAFVLSCIFPPMIFAGFAIHRWLFRGSRFFAGWLSVAIAAWLALVINPVIWLLVFASYVLFGFVAIGVFILAGAVMSIVWRMQDA